MMELLLAWGPFMLILGALLLLAHRLYKSQMKTYDKHVGRVEAVNDQLVEATLAMKSSLDRNTEILEDIRALLKQGDRPN